MEIKHTIEILTKDIQDIEKLVRNLNNYNTPPQIELDLAMSKLRRVYDLLSMISSDIKTDHYLAEKESTEITQVVDNKTDEIPNSEINSTISKEVSTQTDAVLIEEDLAKIVVVPEINTPEEAIENEENPIHPEVKEEESLPMPEAEIKEEVLSPKKKKEMSILADKFEKDKSLNEKIAPGMSSDLSSKIKGGPIDSIKRNIGINDRFLIIRELMNGDNEGFNQLIQKLDDCSNFNEAFKHIQSRFPENMEHDSVKILINLSRRKFISRGNV